jgi:hypothetical protein
MTIRIFLRKKQGIEKKITKRKKLEIKIFYFESKASQFSNKINYPIK